MAKPDHIIIDFDSTFTKVEALDVLAGIVLRDHPNKALVELKISELTNLAMEGKLPFDQALKQRLDLLTITRSHLNELTGLLKEQVSESFKKNNAFLEEFASRIIIISGGFREFIVPVVREYGIEAHHVYANYFLFNEAGTVIGFDADYVLAKAGGKVQLIRSMQLSGTVMVIGDGYTDYEIRQAGLANSFFLFTENIKRISLIEKADQVVGSLDEIIATFQ